MDSDTLDWEGSLDLLGVFQGIRTLGVMDNHDNWKNWGYSARGLSPEAKAIQV